MRLVLIDSRSDRVCGDSSLLASSSLEPRACDTNRIRDVAKAVARLLDQRNGERNGSYEFVDFAPEGSGGYQVFLCGESDEFSHQAEDADPAQAIVLGCFYAGHVCRKTVTEQTKGG
jgi:hypothetical protein